LERECKLAYLVFNFWFLPEPITTLERVEQLPRGNYITIDLKTRKESSTSYCNYHYNNTQEVYSTAVATTRTLVDEAVKRHLVSDVPVGVFLSGGIDSSILTIAAQKQLNTSIETVSIYFDDEKYSEKEFQDIIIKQTGVKHHSLKLQKMISLPIGHLYLKVLINHQQMQLIPITSASLQDKLV